MKIRRVLTVVAIFAMMAFAGCSGGDKAAGKDGDMKPDAMQAVQDVKACTEACGKGCPEPKFQGCYTRDGKYEKFCNKCLATCNGFTEAPAADAAKCDTPKP